MTVNYLKRFVQGYVKCMGIDYAFDNGCSNIS